MIEYVVLWKKSPSERNTMISMCWLCRRGETTREMKGLAAPPAACHAQLLLGWRCWVRWAGPYWTCVTASWMDSAT
ncbi:hypothetical protein ANANG_G00302090 [Anguilla anguilla]|uniref:Uncharacterized protein n=1 Tax=Anguilla anguilla TaxID=7936 RepID=A0A9D3LJP7_ANGAN|nr:hypothetical protein ANANG_G00302090 [Anguilla anguilla]